MQILILTINYSILPIWGQTTDDELQQWLITDYENFANDNCFRLQTAKWNYETNVNAENADELVKYRKIYF